MLPEGNWVCFQETLGGFWERHQHQRQQAPVGLSLVVAVSGGYARQQWDRVALSHT